MRNLFLCLLAFILCACGAGPEPLGAPTPEGSPPVIWVIIWSGFPGQSNNEGVNPGGPGNQTDARGEYYDVLLTSTTPALAETFHALDDTHGKDFEIGKGLLDAGYKVIQVTVDKGSTYANDWIPGGTYYAAGLAEFNRAWTPIKAAHPNDSFVHVHTVDQGEEDARYPTSGIPSLWQSNANQSHAALEAMVGAPMQKFVFKTHSTLHNADGDLTHYAALVNSLQLAFAGSAARLIDRDGDEWEPGGLHSTTTGYIQSARQFVTQFKALNPMGTLSVDPRDGLVNHFRNKGARTPAATHTFKYYVAGVVVSGNGYSDKAITNNTSLWSAASGRVKANAATITFANPTGAQGTIDEVRVFNGATELGRHTLALPVTLDGSSGPLVIAPGGFTLTAPAGCFPDAVIDGLLDLEFGGTSYAQLTTVYPVYSVGSMQAGGSVVGSRGTVTQSTTWGTSSLGIAITAADITLAAQATATHYAEYDAPAAGNLIFTAALPAVPTLGIIPAGGLRTSLQ